MTPDDWHARVAALWSRFDEFDPPDFVQRMSQLTGERPEDPVAIYELGGAYDSTGQEARAAEHYARAFELGLPDEVRRPATIQYASTLRNLGDPHRAVRMLEAERARVSDELDDAVTTFLAFALVGAGAATRAVGEVTAALGAHLPRYQRSVAAYARDLRARDV